MTFTHIFDGPTCIGHIQQLDSNLFVAYPSPRGTPMRAVNGLQDLGPESFPSKLFYTKDEAEKHIHTIRFD